MGTCPECTISDVALGALLSIFGHKKVPHLVVSCQSQQEENTPTTSEGKPTEIHRNNKVVNG